jgi:hypothetical protein
MLAAEAESKEELYVQLRKVKEAVVDYYSS